MSAGSKRRSLLEPGRGILGLAVTWNDSLVPAADWRALVTTAFGPIDRESEIFSNTELAYYEPEMGLGLKKTFVCLKGTQPRESLVAWKIAATAAESAFLDGVSKGRRVNFDPWLLSVENLVVASSKNFPHRIYLGSGVFADLQLVRKKGHYETLPWTYADYAQYRGFFEDRGRSG